MLTDEAVGRGGATAGTVPWIYRCSDFNAARTWHGRPTLPGLGEKGIIHQCSMNGAYWQCQWHVNFYHCVIVSVGNTVCLCVSLDQSMALALFSYKCDDHLVPVLFLLLLGFRIDRKVQIHWRTPTNIGITLIYSQSTISVLSSFKF